MKERIASADAEELAKLEEECASDARKGVREALARARRRVAVAAREQERLSALYGFERELAQERGASVICGLDEVGRGAIAGPLAVGAVIFDPEKMMVERLDDSKKLSPSAREEVAVRIEESACAHGVFYVEPQLIDERGMAACLKMAFSGVLAQVEAQGVHPDIVLVDGNPLHFDEREVNVIKGDARCASIAAASVIAKVARDALMVEMDQLHPGYGFAFHKGYGSVSHIGAVRRLGLSTIHRKTFCTKL